MKTDFEYCLRNKIGFKGYGLKPEKISATVSLDYEGENYTLSHGEFISARNMPIEVEKLEFAAHSKFLCGFCVVKCQIFKNLSKGFHGDL